MKKYILFALIGSFTVSAMAQETKNASASALNTIQLGHQMELPKETSAYSVQSVDGRVFDKSPEVDITKALYGKLAGLNVYQGSGFGADNSATLSIHGHAPLVLIDGFPRSIKDITNSEIESVTILKDAAAAALYGVRGANGVVLITTKRGHDNRLKVTAKYQYGINTQFRAPELADAYTYATNLNAALALDGLDTRYNAQEMDAFKNNTHPYEFPNVNWWDNAYNSTAENHRLNLTFDGGSNRFRYYSVVDYMHDKAFLKSNDTDGRYSTKPSDVRLSIRTNVDVDLTRNTFFKLGVMGKLMETNLPQFGGNYYSRIYNTPSAAFPVRNENGIYGGNSVFTTGNPVALLESTGNKRVTFGTLLADASLKQELNMLVNGLSAELSVAFDNCGSMFDAASRTFRYQDNQATILPDGTVKTTPVITGKDSEVLGHSQSFNSLYMRSNMQGKVNYVLNTGAHQLNSAVVYDQLSYTADGRNNSNSRQSAMLAASYTYAGRYTLNGVLNYSGTSFLPEGDRFNLYPAVSAAWVMSKEKFFQKVTGIDLLKFHASYGVSGWDGNMSHELYRQSYGGSGAGSYFFTNNATGNSGLTEGALPVEGLSPEKSVKTTFGFDLNALNNRLSLYGEAFFERRSDILVDASTAVSGVIGIGVGRQNAGIQEYKGFDASITWNDRIGKFGYGVGANLSYIDSEIINDNQEYQQYDYLYRKGNRVGQAYGLETIGFFQSQADIDNSPVQTFYTVRPGDIKYKDQNDDDRIDEQDVVKMFGSSVPRFYFGFNLNASYKNFELSADFQGMTGVTTSLLQSALYDPLVSNGNISETFLDRETTWSPENANSATMPRLTTQSNANNYRNNSLWYRDGSFLKLRNLYLAYTFPKTMTRFADLKVYLQGTNLFSLDNLGFADPEQLEANYPSTRSYWLGVKFDF